MPIAVIFLGFAVLAVAAVVLLPKASAAKDLNATLAECDALRARLTGERVQGGNPVVAAQLEAQLNACLASANAQGAKVDTSDITLEACTLMQRNIDQEWTHYKSTVWADSVKRNNTRQQVLRLGEDMVACYRRAVLGATTIAGLNKIEAAVRESITGSYVRANCALSNEGSCGRLGPIEEPHNNDKATDELLRIGFPLGAFEVYGPWWEKYRAETNLHLNTTMATVEALNSTSVLRAIRLRREELTPMRTVSPEAAKALNDYIASGGFGVGNMRIK